jgi:DUF1680 family protein
MKQMKRTIFLLVIAIVSATLLISAQKRKETKETTMCTKIADTFVPAPYGSVRIGGYLGDKLDLCIDNRVMAHDIDALILPFVIRNDEDSGFRCEFWGKWFTSAMLSYGYAPTQSHRAVIDNAIDELLKTQTSDGYIGTYPDHFHLGDWDVWGRKYVLLGLIAYYDQTKDTKALEAAKKAADHLIKEAGPESGVNIAATGWKGYRGLAPSSVLEPVMLLYQRTGEPRYLDFAEHIVRMWNYPNVLTPTGIRLIQDVLSEKPMWEVGGEPKAYEMMSNFEGLCEMYRTTGNKLYFQACKSLISGIIRDEIMITGSGSAAEVWCNGKLRQNNPMYQAMETCVTTTWMKLLFQMLRLTGDSQYADQLEISLYNALLSAQTPKGEWWAYYTSLMGERTASYLQYEDVVMSCCVANGPRGLLLTPSWSVMTAIDGPVINFYGKLSSKSKTPAKQDLSVTIDTDYPVNELVKIAVELTKKETFSIRLRIPEWSKTTHIRINGKPYEGYTIPGTYALIHREWANNDRIELVFDLRARVVDAPSGENDAAIMRGPIVLAFDTRMEPFRWGVEVPPMYRYKFLRKDGYIDVKLTDNAANPDIWMTFDIPVADEAGAVHYLKMCDYTSAGNTWQAGNLFRVWTPQPFDVRHLYIHNLDSKVNRPAGDGHVEIPAKYQQ